MATPGNERAAFSPALFTLSQGIVLASLIVRPSPWRWILFLPVLCIHIHLVFYSTTGNTSADTGVMASILTLLITAVDFILLTDVQNELQLKNPKEKGSIANAPFLARCRWGALLLFNPRGIGWKHEVKHLPPRSYTQTRTSFIFWKTLEIMMCLVLQIASYLLNVLNPALISSRDGSLSDYGIFWQCMGMIGFGTAAYAHMNMVHCVAAVFAVGIRLSKPEDWPPMYGSLFNAYTVQRFWSRTWHQFLRRPLTSCTNFVVKKVLRCPDGAWFTAFIRLYVLFFISSLVHGGGEYAMSFRWGTRTILFFMLQAVAITLENFVLVLLGSQRFQNPSILLKVLGYAWVLLWFTWSTKLMVDPMINAGMFDVDGAGSEGANLGHMVLDLLRDNGLWV